MSGYDRVNPLSRLISRSPFQIFGLSMDYFGLSLDYMDVLIIIVLMAVVFYSIWLIGR